MPEKNSSNHLHEWKFGKFVFVPKTIEAANEVIAACVGDPFTCHATLRGDEIERRLNATECLSAEDAEEICGLTVQLADAMSELIDENKSYRIADYDPLLNYAKTLRGEQ